MHENEELFDLATKSENPDSIYPVVEQWLDDVTKKIDDFLQSAGNYIDSFPDQETVGECINLRVNKKQDVNAERRLSHGKNERRRLRNKDKMPAN